MKSLIKFKTAASSLFILFAFGCLAFCSFAQAVLPPPDGGYPGGNTAEGTSSLLSLTTGTFNTAVGFLSLRGNTTSSFNTAIGAGALLANTAFNNTATGAGALLSNNTGEENTANGAFALLSNTEGLFNTAMGAFALQNNTTGFQNTAIGNSALVTNTEGGFNTATGDSALFENTTGEDNTANGESTLGNNTEGNFNTGIGSRALAANTTGDNNTAVGRNALSSSISGNSNIALGGGAGGQVTTASNVICIGTNVGGANVDNSCFIGNIRDAVVAPDAVQVLIDSVGKLGTTSGSSLRFKTQIKPMDRASEAIFALKPVTFHYKTDAKNTPCFGLIAEEVAKINPALVVRDKNGDLFTVRYDQVNAMLLNEFLKEHKKVQQLEASLATQRKDFRAAITELKQEMKNVVAPFKKEDAKIQKTSAQVELKQAEPRTIANK